MENALTTLWCQMQWLRQQVDYYFEDELTTLGLTLDLFIMELIVLSTGIFVAETYPLPDSIRAFLQILNGQILWIFVVEYGLRLWSARSRFRFIISFYSLIDLLTIVPFLLGLFNIGFVRLLRGFRVLRLARFLAYRGVFRTLGSEDLTGFARIVFTLFAIVFVYSGFIYQVEHRVNPQVFATFSDAFYFSAVTMTTVGYGDLTPISQAGRLLTVLMSFTGVALVPWQVGDLIRRLLVSPEQRIPCPQCDLQRHDRDAVFCKRCGTALPGLRR